MEILVYITDNKERVLGGDPLTLYMPENGERQDILFTLSGMLHAQVMQLKNGDHLIISK